MFGASGRVAFNRPMICALIWVCSLAVSSAEESLLFRIGTGNVNDTYFPIGSVISQVLTQPESNNICLSGECGVRGLLAIAQASNGSVANVNEIRLGRLESALVQSDVAYWAYSATGSFTGEPSNDKLRAIAKLYNEDVHLVTRKDAGIKTVSDLRGKQVSIGEPGSGTMLDAHAVLDGSGINLVDIDIHYIKSNRAAEKLLAGEIEAFFMVAKTPSAVLSSLAEDNEISLLSIDGEHRDAILRSDSHFQAVSIPDKSYPGVKGIETIGVSALLVVSSEIDSDLVYQITKTFWSDPAQKIFSNSHDAFEAIRLESALQGISIPLHKGAIRFYSEIGMLSAD